MKKTIALFFLLFLVSFNGADVVVCGQEMDTNIETNIDASSDIDNEVPPTEDESAQVLDTTVPDNVESPQNNDTTLQEPENTNTETSMPIEASTVSTPTITAGSRVDISLNFTAKEGYYIRNINMEVSTDINKFPFVLEQSSYLVTYNDVSSANYSVNLRSRADAVQNYYLIPLEVLYWDGEKESTQIFEIPIALINLDSVPEEAITTGIPKVILERSSTVPGSVEVGMPFILELTIKNTSHLLSVNSVKISLSSEKEVFVSLSGSNTAYIDTLSPGQSKTIKLEFISQNSISPGTYLLNIRLDYDAINANEIMSSTQNESVSVSVTQKPKVDYSQIVATPPNQSTVGQEVNLMGAIYNVGKTTISNVLVKISCDNDVLSQNEQFVGNVLPGNSGNIDVYLTTQKEGDTVIHMSIQYEDDSGNQYNHDMSIPYYGVARVTEEIIPEPVKANVFSTGITILPIVLIILGTSYIVFAHIKKVRQLKRSTDEADEFELDDK